MEEKLEEILQKAESDLYDFDKEITQLQHRAMFLQNHSFNKEKEWVYAKLDAKREIFYRYKTTVENLREMLNKWNS
ncbi:hypothetical protein [Pleomorphovibrio marinus]|uniref:hypothetical protein n=1 Tax=Pleomorphovibrio marinus TaxID=2164132 RepID=UPI000E0AB5AE|nr:hypothetical protein [Pleomorphovibrio marinus]